MSSDSGRGPLRRYTTLPTTARLDSAANSSSCCLNAPSTGQRNLPSSSATCTSARRLPFRAAGVPVPESTTTAMLDRLTKAIARTGAATILCLGDLLHAPTGRTPVALEAVSTWRKGHRQLQFVLVRGNHDTRSGDPPDDWDVRCVDEPWSLGPLPGVTALPSRRTGIHLQGMSTLPCRSTVAVASRSRCLVFTLAHSSACYRHLASSPERPWCDR